MRFILEFILNQQKYSHLVVYNKNKVTHGIGFYLKSLSTFSSTIFDHDLFFKKNINEDDYYGLLSWLMYTFCAEKREMLFAR